MQGMERESHAWEGITMKNKIITWLTLTVLICLFMFSGYKVAFSQQGEESKAIFTVQ